MSVYLSEHRTTNEVSLMKNDDGIHHSCSLCRNAVFLHSVDPRRRTGRGEVEWETSSTLEEKEPYVAGEGAGRAPACRLPGSLVACGVGRPGLCAPSLPHSLQQAGEATVILWWYWFITRIQIDFLPRDSLDIYSDYIQCSVYGWKVLFFSPGQLKAAGQRTHAGVLRLLHWKGAVLSTYWRQDPPPAERFLWPAPVCYLIYCADLEPSPWGVPVRVRDNNVEEGNDEYKCCLTLCRTLFWEMSVQWQLR